MLLVQRVHPSERKRTIEYTLQSGIASTGGVVIAPEEE